MGILRRLFGKGNDESGSQEFPVGEPGFEQRPFNTVQLAEEFAKEGKNAQAEKSFLRAISEYRALRDKSGLGYAMGRLGNFYHELNRLPDAVKIYEDAVSHGTDVPAIYMDLMLIYSETRNEDGLFRTADAYFRNSPRRQNEVPRLLVGHAARPSKDGDFASAERWLARAEGWAVSVGDQMARFKAWGERGLVVERSGDKSRSIAIFEAAVAAGSPDRTTYTRLLMAYEQAKQWDEALELARRALGVQHEAAWEEDIRKRIARIEQRKNGSGKRTTSDVIPAFSVRHGASRLRLISQTNLKLAASHLSVVPGSQHVLISTTSAKPENIVLMDLESETPIWSASASGPSSHVLSLGRERFLVANDSGRIGDGHSDLLFLDSNGQAVATAELPDKLSEIGAAGDLVVAGCRDGHLYAFDSTGRRRWRFRVPVREDLKSDVPSSRPCPYFVRVDPSGESVLFSSWDTVYMVDANGKLRWSWRATTEPKRMQFSVPLTGNASAEEYYRVLGLKSNASLDEVRKAFRLRALATHPDRNRDDVRTGDKFREAVQAYEAILSGASRTLGGSAINVEISISGGMTTIYGLALGQKGSITLVAASDGSLTSLDGSGRPTRHLVASEGAGYLVATPDLGHVVYSHWGGFNFYEPRGLIGILPSEQLHSMSISPDGQNVAAWSGKSLQAFTTAGQSIAEVEFARTVSDVVFLDKSDIVVAAGKLIRLRLS